MSLIRDEKDIEQGMLFLRAQCPYMDQIAEICGNPPLRWREPGFGGLVTTIVSQQLSTASAAAITKKVFANIDPVTPENILKASEEVLRLSGLSMPKIRTLRALSEAILHGQLPFNSLGELPVDEAQAALTAIPGIGPWTAEVYMMFCLGVQDIFAPADLALQEGTRMIMALEVRPSTRQMAKIAQRWQPWRAVAARMLWSYYGLMKKVKI